MKRSLAASSLALLTVLLLVTGCASLPANPLTGHAGPTAPTPAIPPVASAVAATPTVAVTSPTAVPTPASESTGTPDAAQSALPTLPTPAGPELTGLGPLEIPVRVRIPRIGVDAAIETVGLEADGTMGTPQNFSDVGWYGYGPTPGQAGVAVLAGHVDSVHGPAVFWYLRDLKPGDAIEVDLFGGGTRRFVVDGSGTYPSDAAPIASIFSWDGPPRLSLITCGGIFDRSVHAYDHRLIIYAHLTAPASGSSTAAERPVSFPGETGARVPPVAVVEAAGRPLDQTGSSRMGVPSPGCDSPNRSCQ